jgi:hypothetical protein
LETKQQVMDAVNTHLGLPMTRVSTGSTEPREFLQRIVELLGLPVPQRDDKPGLAKCVVEGAGLVWLPTHESRGSTVTLLGLIAVREAVFLLAPLDGAGTS